MGAEVASGGAFDGARGVIALAFGEEQRATESLRQLCARMHRKPIPEADYPKLVAALYALVESNCSPTSTSKQNWRWKPQTKLDRCNTDPEILLERAVAMLAEAGHLANWSNQVPVISGHTTKSQRKCAVDLACWSGGRLDLIELKWASDTPIFAAFEILLYGLAYIFCRLTPLYLDQPVMRADTVSLNVLMREGRYDGLELRRFEDGIASGFDALLKRKLSVEVAGDFRLLKFPSGFDVPFKTGADVVGSCRKVLLLPPGLQMCDAINRISPVHQVS